MSNSTLSNSKGFQSPTGDLSIEINRSDLEFIMASLSTFATLSGEGNVKLDGDATIVQKHQHSLGSIGRES